MEQYNDNSSILYERLYDSVTGNPIIIPTTEVQECNNHGIITLSLIPNESEGLEFPELNNMHEVYNSEDVVGENDFYCNYKRGDVYLHESKWHKKTKISYKGEGISFIGANRVYTQRDKDGNVVQTLDYIIEKGMEAIESLLIIGSAIQVLYRLEQDIADGNELHTNLQSDISTGEPLHTQLRKDINDANTFKDQLNEDVADGKILDESLKVQNPRAEQNLANLNKAITDCADDIANITKTDNGVAIVTTANWGTADSEGFYHCTVTHTANSKDLNLNIFDYTDNVQGESVMVTVTPLTDTTFKVSSIENTPIKIVFASGYYGGHTSANTRDAINELNSSLEDNANNFANKNNSVGAVVTFIDDNGEKLFHDTWDIICSETGIKVGIAVVSDWVGTNPSWTKKGYLSVDDLKLLQSQGHEIYSHSKSHADWKNLTETEIENECRLSKEFLIENGLSKESDILVYSNGIKANDLRVKNIARKYYKYGVSTFMAGNTNYNTTPVDNWAVIRMDADNSTLEQMKSALDEAIATNGWLIFMSHSFNFAEGSIQKFKDFINYAKGLNVPILPFKQASLLKGNVMAQGEKTSSNKVFISADGRGDINNIEGLKILTDSNMDADLSNYPVGYMSVKKISSGNDTHFRTGGTLITYNFFDISGYAVQVFHCYNKNQSHKRIWNGSDWGDWVLNDVYLDTGYNITDLLDKYTTGISLRRISPPNDTIFGVGGALITFNYSTLNGYSFQMLVQKDLGKIYIRNWNGTTWNDFIGDSYIVSQTKDSGSILNKAITEFKQFSTVVTAVSNTANAPDGATGGIYTVTRFSSSMEHYGYSEYKVYNKNDLYRRYWTTGGDWSEWEKVTQKQV